MSRFIQIHALTVYAPSNLNRDDTGRPKTARFGGAERLRISSQALKRAIRTSAAFKQRLDGHLGVRTARIANDIRDELIKVEFELPQAAAIAKTLSGIFGSLDDKKSTDDRLLNKELYFMAPEEKLAIPSIVQRIAAEPSLAEELAQAAGITEDESEEDEDGEDGGDKKKARGKKKGFPKKKLNELRARVLVTTDTAADIAMFGRMVASAPEFNREAAVQVAHAITTHKVEVEDDFYTAVDDLKKPSEDAGAGFIGELGFGSGVFYVYVCIDRDLLESNLGGNAALASTAITALVEGVAKASPTGKQASFASRAHASYVRVEKGPQQPRSLAAAFLKPVRGDDLLQASIGRIEDPEVGLAEQMNAAYGACYEDARVMQFVAGEPAGMVTMADIIAFAAE